ncbi:Pectinesterase, Tyr active site [Parasponia andersonii]|uniref:Pectinesterase n=1 Tax=Parasponia andersonii TaxID=3476 RepID=A0A2P5CGK5_PARAD|nr:Pectinesterase, Tyr active site [Parasponia andersonii]
MGDGFIARDITFVNSAGPAKHQAVALRVGSDRSVVFRCSILGYQDTLYTHSKRQFYRETDIYGTVDFIFGNSAVVFQSCNIFSRKPASSGLRNFVTAQGRSSPDQNTGISIHNCRISAASDLAPVKSSYETYLGRPWKQYSRTVIMESFLDDSISPAGWSSWSGGFGLKTLFYGEYMNTGPGASTGRRVNWAGYHASLTAPQANSFTVAGFISGNVWLPSTGVSFDSGLLG